jgi:hypothetical protein
MDAEKVRIFLESLSDEQTELGNRKDQEEPPGVRIVVAPIGLVNLGALTGA